MDENRLLELLHAHLLRQGFPSASLVRDWRVARDAVVDLAAIDPNTGTPLALFEVKSERDKRVLARAEAFLRRVQDRLEGTPTLYVAIPADGEESVRLIEVPERPAPNMKEKRVGPDYMNLRTESLAQSASKEKKSLDRLTFLSTGLAAALAFLLILDFNDVIQLSAERLTALGLVVAPIVIPFASRIKIAGLEFERAHKSQSEGSES